jgi:hypothetical protein
MAFYVSLDLMDQKGLIIWFGLGFNFQQYFSYIVVLLVEETGENCKDIYLAIVDNRCELVINNN